ncbi:major facilitator superfamily domain-containing protein [Nemania sp. NC0429]|nr:major facilitator superfamily domain-containing protein [Nemania sp. NC0429]
MALKAKLRQIFYPPSLPGEKKLVRKIDFFILTFSCLGYFTNYLARSNIDNAYGLGMKEELGFAEDSLTQIKAAFTAGYVVGQIPVNLSLHYVRPRVFFPACMVAWAGLSMVTAAVHNAQSIAAIRFFLGVAEASTFVGTHYILGSWYTKRELGKRSGLFTASGLVGALLGGFIQTGIWSSLDQNNGLSGWRWLFIINGLITLPVAAFGFVFFPDTPSTTKAFYLSDDEKALAIARVPRVANRSPWSWRFVKRTATSKLFWGFMILWILAGEIESFSSNGLLGQWLRNVPGHPFTEAEANLYPTFLPAVGIGSALVFPTITDFLNGRRYVVAYFVAGIGIITPPLILAAQRLPFGYQSVSMVIGSYTWAGTVSAGQAAIFAWANDALSYEEHMLRAVVLAGMNVGSLVINAWWSIVFYGAWMAPWFTRGMYAMIAVSIVLAVWTGAFSYYLARYHRAREEERNVESVEESSEESIQMKEKDDLA